MADFETKLRRLSERGSPVGAEELIERIEAEMAGDPLVVVAKRREGTVMTKTQQPPTTSQLNRYRGPAWAVAISLAVVLVATGLYLALSGDGGELADPPPPTTVAPEVATLTDLEVIQAGVAAFYSGDSERAAQLFELPDRTDDQIRGEAAYQSVIGGRLSLSCTEQVTPGEFFCHAPYHNAITDAVNLRDRGDTFRVVVKDGVIREFSFPEHSGLMVPLAAFISQVEGNQACDHEELLVLPRTADCATLVLENLDEFAAYYEANK